MSLDNGLDLHAKSRKSELCSEDGDDLAAVSALDRSSSPAPASCLRNVSRVAVEIRATRETPASQVTTRRCLFLIHLASSASGLWAGTFHAGWAKDWPALSPLPPGEGPGVRG